MEDRKGFRAIKRQTLIGQLQKLLDQYSDGQIIKELIQNAEDGGANKVKILFVNQQYETDTRTWIEDPVLFGLKGPALCVYNDGIFNQDDWESIAAIQCSAKENKPLQVGRFGLGFKSVFHITDTPLIISGNSLMIMNPEADESDVVYNDELISLEHNCQEALLQLMSGIFDFTKEVLEKGFYNGSLFWFPLRQKSSRLSKKVYDEREIRNIFLCFTKLAPSYLLFLKGIEEIEIFETKPTAKRKLFQVGLKNQNIEYLRKERADFLKQILSFNGKLAPNPISKSLVLTIRSEGFHWLKQKHTEDMWLVVNHYRGGQVSQKLKTLINDDDWNYSPYVSLGACITSPIDKGHVFCFLPLPEESESLTGFPLHVNGYFALSQDRHHVKWNSSEALKSNGNMERSITWNTLLVEEILPIVYSELLIQLVQPSGQMKSSMKTRIPESLIYGIFPNITKVTTPWKGLVRPLYNRLQNKTCIFTRKHNGKWILPSDAIFMKNENPHDSMIEIIEDILLQCDFEVARTDKFITDALYDQGCQLTFLTTKHITKLFSLYPKLQISRAQKSRLLQFMLIENSQDLEGLPLLPLADGSFGTFNRKSDKVYFVQQKEDVEMFPGIKDCFADLNVDAGLQEKLHNLYKSEKFQLMIFEPKHVPKLLHKCIKKNEWMDVVIRKKITEWLVKVWAYIGRHQDLKEYVVDLHLLPEEDSSTGKKYLKKASKVSILSGYPGFQKMGKVLQSALKMLNITIYSTLPESISSVIAGDYKFVEFPGMDGVSNCLKKIVNHENLLHDAVSKFNEESTAEEKGEIRKVCTSITNLSEITELIERLALFPSWGNEEYVSLLDVNKVYDPRQQPKIPITPFQNIIICNDNHTRKIAEMCGVTIISTYELWKGILSDLKNTSCYNKSERETFMMFFKDNVERFGNENKKELMKLARNVCFVHDQHGNLHSSNRMLDPRSPLLRRLFNDDMSLFPVKQDKDYLDFLILLGLRCEKDITDGELMKCADTIESSDCAERASALMEYLTKYGEHLYQNTFEIISTKKCCHVMYQRPLNYPKSMPFNGDGDSERLEKISSLLPASCAKLVGANAYIANSNISKHFENFMVSSNNMDDKVIDQLHILVDSYSTNGGKEHNKYMSVLMDIYSFLSETDQASVTGLLESEVIYTDGTFKKPMCVWLLKRETDILLEPYAYCLPEHLRTFKELFHKMGCEYHQTTGILLKTLKAIQEFHENGSIHSRETVNRDSKLAITIINVLADSKEDLSQKILLPVVCETDDALKLKPADECAICSDDWYNDIVLTLDESDPFYIVHKKISQDTALKFNVKHVSDVLLENTKHFDLNYGQKEPLTTRICNIIKDYTDGFTIPKEIIQNADDAGASTVKFLYDERTVEKAQTCLFSDKMLPFQGPAFWAYNNKEFGAKDFENIIKLAGATKMEDKTKIGRFGLGFNSVYNLTDVPSFLSGDTYVVFDPHEVYLGKCGLKVDLNHKRNRIIRQKMKGQFYPFEGIFGCRIVDEETVKFNGTLFRFPLRGPEEADMSKIKQKSYSKKDMVEFLNRIMKSAGNLLLFTQHVKVVELYHLERNSKANKEPDLLMRVSKSSDRTGTSIINTLTESSCTESQILEEIEINLEIKSHGLCGLQSSKSRVSYMICWSYGKVAANLTAQRKELHGLLPVAATAVTEQSMNDLAGFYDTSHLFCFLPLPILTDLPFHINASFAVQSSRRGLVWQNEDDIGNSSEELWNRTILEDPVCVSYISMLTRMVMRLPVDTYYTLWPSESQQSKHDKIISKQIYKITSDSEDLVFPHENGAVCLKQAVLLDPKLRNRSNEGVIAMQALKNFGSDDGFVVDLPKSLQYGFRCAGCEDKLVSRTLTAVQFFKSVVFTTITNSYWSKGDLDKLLLHGLMEYRDELSHMFISTPCIPTKPHGNRKTALDLIHPNGQLAQLYLEDEECFPDNNFMDYNVLAALASLGMKENEMDWEALPERVSKLINPPDLMATRINHLFNYLLSKSTNSEKERYTCCPDHIREKLYTMHFLPILKKDREWSMPWKGDEFQENYLIAPRDGYHSDLRNLIGCVKLVVNAAIFSTYRSKTILNWFGLKGKKECLDVDIVVENMINMSNYISKSGDKCTEMNPALENSFYDMYDLLMKFMDGTKPNHLRDSLAEHFVILHSKTLKAADQMVLHLSANLTPYLFGVESRYRKFEKLFLMIGVHPNLSIDLLVRTLHSISKDYQSKTLSQDIVDCINSICIELEKISMDKTGEKSKELYKDVKLPSEDNILIPIENLYFDDCKWFGKKCDSHLIHVNKKFSPQVAKHLGVKSKRVHYVGSKSSPFYSEFAQHEKLTNRLRRILEGYPCTETIMKELLQNADDAGSTEVIFIKDFRNLSTQRLPLDSLEKAQGPALCIYNNAAFTEKDIDGIQSLGEGSKFDEILKTGKYGVGFNVVYHITDFPSLWTRGDEIGETVCMFDPNRKYLEIDSEQKPGLRINVEQFRELYPDFMEGYIPTVTGGLKKGTLFRLPLRTERMALDSELKKIPTHTKDVETLLQKLKEDITTNILFLDNIRTVKIGSVKENGCFEIEHETTKYLNENDNEKQKKYVSRLKQLSRSFEERDFQLWLNPMEIRIIVDIQSSNKKDIQSSNKKDISYIVVKRAGFPLEGEFSVALTEALSTGAIKTLPRGGVALRRSNEREEGLAYCMLPLPIKTGLPVHVNGQFALDYESRHNISCNLNSIDTQWNEHLAKFLIVPSYISALEMYKERVFTGKNTSCRNGELQMAVTQLETKLPIIDESNGDFWRNLSKDVYKYIAAEKIELFPVFTESPNKWSDINWTAVKIEGNDDMLGFFNQLDEYFPQQAVQSTTIYRSTGSVPSQNRKTAECKDEKKELTKLLLELGMKIVRTSKLIFSQFQKSDCSVQTASPLNVLEFLKSFADKHVENRFALSQLPALIKDTGFKDRASLKLAFKFVLKEIEKENAAQLYGSPLLLLQDGYLNVFDERTTIFVSEYCDLIPEKSDEFISSAVVSILDKYVESFPLKRWNIQSLVSMLLLTKPNMCEGNIINYPPEHSEQVKKWIKRVWDFLLPQCQKEGSIDESLLHPLMDMSLLPVTSGSYFQLYPISKREYVLWLDPRKNEFSELMIKREMPILTLALLSELVVKTDSRSAVLSLLNKNCTLLVKMSIEEAKTIMGYFTNTCDFKEIENIEQIRNLPIFLTMAENLVSINRRVKYISLRDLYNKIPKEGLEKWFNTSGIVLLKYEILNHSLFKKVGVDVVEPTQLYIDHILIDCSTFNDEDLLCHLIYIRDVLMQETRVQDEKKLKDRLRNLPFLPRPNGNRALASDFYDSSHDVFISMSDHLEFPPAPFDEDIWRQFLLDAGLICDISVQLFETFARKVSRLTVNEKTRKKSRTLVRYWTYAKEKFQLESSCVIKQIKFIERNVLSDQSLNVGICDQFTDEHPFIAFEGSYISSLVDYTWTVANTLPWESHYRLPETVRTELGVKNEVEPEIFVKNFQNVCRALEDKTKLKRLANRELTTMFKSFYKYIQDKKKNVNFSLLANFSTILVPEQMKLVRSNRVFLEPNREQTIKHHIYKAPVEFQEYFEALKKLGVRDTPVSSVYVEVLKDIHDLSDGKPLEPNESKIVSTCLQQLINLMKHDVDDDLSIPLYLPDDKGVMKKSSTLIFLDNLFLKGFVESMGFAYFIGFRELEVQIDDPLLQFESWPQPYQMRILSDLLVKKIDPSCLKNAKTNRVALKIMGTLNNADFHYGVIRLARHFQHETGRSVLKEEEAKAKIKQLCEIKCMEIEHLTIEFFHNDVKIEESRDSEKVFVARGGPRAKIVLYLDRSLEPDDPVDLVTTLGQIINDILGVKITDYFSAIWNLALRSDEISKFLDKKGIRASDFKSESNNLLFPPPGTPIPENMHYLLDCNFCDFDNGEYVGLELFDPCVQSEEIENISDDPEELEMQQKLNESPMYIFAIIVEKVSEEDIDSFATYKVNVGVDEFVEMHSTAIYKISRPKVMFSKELIPIEDSGFEQAHHSTKSSSDVSRILREIRLLLTKAYRNPDVKERSRVFKRLILRWHPDKNLEDMETANYITQMLQHYIYCLENGLPLEDSSEERASDSTDGTSSRKSYYSGLFREMRSRGSRYAKQSYSERSTFNGFSFSEPHPMPGQATRWLRQARYDLEEAELSLQRNSSSHNWICYKCQQAAEKSLKAIWFSKDARRVSQSHNLRDISFGLSDEIRDLACDLQRKIGDHVRMRYPDTLLYPKVPFDVYDISHSSEACKITRDIIRLSTRTICT